MGKLLVFRPGARRPRVNGPRRRSASAPRQCDFCSTLRPPWRHQSLDFAACEACHHQLVETGRCQGLAEPSSAPRLCDFCTAPRLAAWRHPSLDFVACDVCHRLIEAGERKGLAERTYATAPVEPDLKAAPGFREALMGVILELHDKFFERAAPARPVLTLRPISIRPPQTPSPARGVGSTTSGRPSA